MVEGENKGQRLLGIYHRLYRGELISKEVLAREYGVTEKSIQRDIDDIRSYLAGDRDKGAADICYDRQAKGYRLVEEESRCLTRKEILAMAKILLESRAFAKEELHTILDKLIEACPREPREGRKVVEDMIRNETFCYVPPRHGRKLLDALWDISLLDYVIIGDGMYVSLSERCFMGDDSKGSYLGNIIPYIGTTRKIKILYNYRKETHEAKETSGWNAG